MPEDQNRPTPAGEPASRPIQLDARLRDLASYSHIGGREEQQDAVKIWQDSVKGNSLMVICDGVGGSRAGGKASALVIHTAEQLWTDRAGVLADPRKDLMSLSRVAHERICDLSEEGEKRAPASTIVALYLTPKEAHWIHSGDSRLYRFRGVSLTARTRDHSVVQILVDQGEVSEDAMGTHPDQGRLLQSLGSKDYREPSYGRESVEPEDAFLLCTDGFWERTPVVTMAALMRFRGEQLENRLRKAVMRAVALNGKTGDNVSVAVAAPLKVVDGDTARSRLIVAIVLVAIATLAVIGGLVWIATRDPVGDGKAPVKSEAQSQKVEGANGSGMNADLNLVRELNPPDPAPAPAASKSPEVPPETNKSGANDDPEAAKKDTPQMPKEPDTEEKGTDGASDGNKEQMQE